MALNAPRIAHRLCKYLNYGQAAQRSCASSRTFSYRQLIRSAWFSSSAGNGGNKRDELNTNVTVSSDLLKVSTEDLELLTKSEDECLEKILQDIKELEKLKKKYEEEISDLEISEHTRKAKTTKDESFDTDINEFETVENAGDIADRKSNVPCGGCGVKLNCIHPERPGYVPLNLFSQLKEEKLPELLCQRCIFMNKHKKIVHQEVDKEVYEHIFGKIRKPNNLVVMLVDVTDITNSVIHEFLREVKVRSSVILVGNKIDLIPMDNKDYKKRVMRRLKAECLSGSPQIERNILQTCLISAKTGYGVELLISKLFSCYFHYEGKY